MITRNDCLLLLKEISDNKKIDTSEYIKDLVSKPTPSMEVIKFINDNRELSLTKFYTKLRKSYNNKHSKLYINIMKEVTDGTPVLTTLASLSLQILLFAESIEDKQLFLKHARFDEICKALYSYSQSYDLTHCINLIRAFKIDIKALESLK